MIHLSGRLLRALVPSLVLLVLLATMARAQDEQTSFMLNNSQFVFYHEIGHLFVGEFDLPVLGKEEDAADNLAAWLLLNQDDEAADAVLEDSADGWYYSAEADGQTGEQDDDSLYYDEHSLDLQRSYAIVCLMVGAYPEYFAETADEFDLPQDQRDSCEGTYGQVSQSWDSLLAPHAREKGDDRGEQIEVTYDVSDNYPDTAQALQESGMLENAAEMIEQNYVLPRALTFHATECDEENAYYSYSDAQITFCYELAQFYMQLYDDIYSGGSDEDEAE